MSDKVKLGSEQSIPEYKNNESWYIYVHLHDEMMVDLCDAVMIVIGKIASLIFAKL